MVRRGCRGRRGSSTLGCLVTLALFAAVLYYGVNIGKVWLRFYQYQDEMKSAARLAPSLSDAVIRRRLVERADDLVLPEAAQHVKVTRSGKPRRITIEAEYSESVDLPLFKHIFVFRPRAEEPL